MPNIRSVVQAVSQSAATRVDGILRTIGLAKKFGAAAAYSFRDIGADGGPVVNVTKNADANQRQDFTATEITNGTLEAFIGAGNNGTIRTWYDQSGNGKHLEGPSDITREPILVSNGTLVTDNGKPALSCNTFEYFKVVNNGSVNTSAFYLVINVTSSTTEVARDVMGTNGGNDHWFRFNNNDYENLRWNTVSHQFDKTAEDQQIIISVDIDSSNILRYFEDGSQSGANKSGSTGQFVMERFLKRSTATNEFKGKVQEAIFFDSDKTAERTEITNLINAHYGAF